MRAHKTCNRSDAARSRLNASTATARLGKGNVAELRWGRSGGGDDLPAQIHRDPRHLKPGGRSYSTGSLDQTRTGLDICWSYVCFAWFVSATVGAIVLFTGEAISREDVDRIQKNRATDIAEAYLDEGKSELQRGRNVRAIRLLSEAIKKGAGIDAYRLRSQAHFGGGKYAEAMADITRVLESGSAGPADYVLRGDVYNVQLNHAAALSDYDKAIHLDPLWVDSYRGRGSTYVAMEKYDLAVRDFHVVIQKVSGDPEASFNMGIACMLADLPAAARSWFQKTLQTESSPRWIELTEKWLAELPQTSDFEQRVGGLSGYLAQSTHTSKPTTNAAGSTPPVVGPVQPRISSPSDLGRGDAPSPRRSPPKGLADLQKSLNAASPRDRTLTGDLAGSYMGFRWTFRFDAKGRDVSATIRVHHPTGREETHLCKGTVDGSFVDASDQMGYRFQGRLTNDLRLIGMLTTNHGQSFSVNMPLEE